MKAIRKWLAVEYKISRGLALWFVAAAIAVQLLWPAFADSWTSVFTFAGAGIVIAVACRLVSRFRRRPDDGGFET